MRDRDAAIQRMIADACFGADTTLAIRSDPRGFLASHGIEAGDAEAILPGVARLALYRRLVRNNLLGVTAKMMPITRARLNAVAGGAFDASFDAFLAEIGPRTHYLRDVPAEFLAWVAPRWSDQARTAGGIPPYASDLASHELVEMQVAATPRPAERAEAGELALDRPLVFSEAQRLVRYAYAVHELPSDPDDRTTPDARPVTVFVYRNADHDVGWTELPGLRARALEALLQGAPLGEAITRACRDEGTALTDAVVADVAELLAELAQEGVLLGATG